MDIKKDIEYLDRRNLWERVEHQAGELKNIYKVERETAELLEQAYILGYTKALKEILEDEEI